MVDLVSVRVILRFARNDRAGSFSYGRMPDFVSVPPCPIPDPSPLLVNRPPTPDLLIQLFVRLSPWIARLSGAMMDVIPSDLLGNTWVIGVDLCWMIERTGNSGA